MLWEFCSKNVRAYLKNQSAEQVQIQSLMVAVPILPLPLCTSPTLWTLGCCLATNFLVCCVGHKGQVAICYIDRVLNIKVPYLL